MAVDLHLVNARLEAEVAGLRRVEAELRARQVELEEQAALRTADLDAAKAALRDETAQRLSTAEALAQSESRFKRVVDSNMMGLLFWDADGAITDANDCYLDMIGYDRADLAAGRIRWKDITPPEYAQADVRGLAELAVRGTCTPFEKEYVRRDGTRIPVLVGGASFPGSSSGVAFVLDISERRRNEQARDRLAAIIVSSNDAIISKDITGIITSWNPAAEAMFGYQASEAVGMAVQSLVPPDRPGEEPDILARIARGETISHFETVRKRKDGTLIDVSVTISPIKDGSNRIIGASKIARDITSRKESEAKVRDQLARLDLLHQITRAMGEKLDLESIFQVVLRCLEDRLPIDFCCICLYDPTAQHLTVANVGIRSLALAMELALPQHANIPIDRNGLSRCVSGHLVYEPDLGGIDFPFPQRLVRGGLNAFVAVPLLVEKAVIGVIIVARRRAASFSSGECEFLHQLGEHVALASHQNRLHTALQQAYDELRTSQRTMLEQERLRALGQMASGIAHDINNAISPAMLYVDLLVENERGVSDKGRQRLEIVQRAIEDISHTVARLGEFYRQGERGMAPSAVALNELVLQVIDLTRARWSDMPQQRGIVVHVHADLARDLPAIAGVPSEIREALINLVFNAVDAMPAGGDITIRTLLRSADGMVAVEVADTGAGMDDETRRRCLEPFFTTKGTRGSGLGLSMVFGIAKRHDALLDIESAVGSGTTIRLSFPLPSASSVVAEERPFEAKVARSLRILVIDDDPLLLATLREILVGDNHTVVAADGGTAGIELFRSSHGTATPFDVVMTDLGMPHTDGRAVAAAVKAVASAMPVILLTGWGRSLLTQNDIPPHVDCVLSKPPRVREIRGALARWCGN